MGIEIAQKKQCLKRQEAHGPDGGRAPKVGQKKTTDHRLYPKQQGSPDGACQDEQQTKEGCGRLRHDVSSDIQKISSSAQSGSWCASTSLKRIAVAEAHLMQELPSHCHERKAEVNDSVFSDRNQS